MTVVSPPPAPIRAPLRIDVTEGGTVSPALKAAWAALSDNATEPNCFMEAWFALPSLAYLGDDRVVRLLSAWEGDALVGVILLTTAPRYGRMPARHTCNWQSVQSFYGAPLIRSGHEARFWVAVLDALDEADWAPSFLSISGLGEGARAHQGLIDAAKQRGDTADTVHCYARALLSSALTPEDYLEESLRGKKRKELRRQANRLGELGAISYRTLSDSDDLNHWIASFLVLESSGWKGSDGAAFANTPQSRAFFEDIIRGARSAGALEILRIDLDGQAIAMLINFIRSTGSYSFKIAYNEDYARFSLGVLIELENLKRILTNPQIHWMDSCASANHPMINSLWMERRSIVQVSVPLKGARRRLIFRICRLVENLAKFRRQWSKI